MKEFILDILRQLFGLVKPRNADIIFTKHAFNKMREYGLDISTIEDSFRYGTERAKGMVVHKYSKYEVGMFIKPDETHLYNKDTYLIITVWKYDYGL